MFAVRGEQVITLGRLNGEGVVALRICRRAGSHAIGPSRFDVGVGQRAAAAIRDPARDDHRQSFHNRLRRAHEFAVGSVAGRIFPRIREVVEIPDPHESRFAAG